MAHFYSPLALFACLWRSRASNSKCVGYALGVKMGALSMCGINSLFLLGMRVKWAQHVAVLCIRRMGLFFLLGHGVYVRTRRRCKPRRGGFVVGIPLVYFFLSHSVLVGLFGCVALACSFSCYNPAARRQQRGYFCLGTTPWVPSHTCFVCVGMRVLVACFCDAVCSSSGRRCQRVSGW